MQRCNKIQFVCGSMWEKSLVLSALWLTQNLRKLILYKNFYFLPMKWEAISRKKQETKGTPTSNREAGHEPVDSNLAFFWVYASQRIQSKGKIDIDRIYLVHELINDGFNDISWINHNLAKARGFCNNAPSLVHDSLDNELPANVAGR